MTTLFSPTPIERMAEELGRDSRGDAEMLRSMCGGKGKASSGVGARTPRDSFGGP